MTELSGQVLAPAAGKFEVMPREDESNSSQLANNGCNSHLDACSTSIHALLQAKSYNKTTLPSNLECSGSTDVHEAGRLTTLKTLPFAFNDSPLSPERSAMGTGLKYLGVR